MQQQRGGGKDVPGANFCSFHSSLMRSLQWDSPKHKGGSTYLLISRERGERGRCEYGKGEEENERGSAPKKKKALRAQKKSAARTRAPVHYFGSRSGDRGGRRDG